MKRVLIISPYFPPSNAADMQRVRISLPYFKSLGWEATVIAVDEKFTDIIQDDMLVKNIPPEIRIYKVSALNKSITSKLGFGSLAFRSMLFYRNTVNTLLKKEKYDLIYFSTTQFPICVLGAYWKNKFRVPYVIDMQDPWYSDYYDSQPKHQRPRLYKLVYTLHKKLEAIAMKNVAGLISVSEAYINDLELRYPRLSKIPSATITFGAFEPDMAVASANQDKFKPLLQNDFINIVYAGRGGGDMHQAISLLFKSFKKGLIKYPELFTRLKLYFIGTSYAPTREAAPTIIPLGVKYGVEKSIVEITQRISYFHTLITLQQAHALFIPGSDDPKYTASKIYPYLLTKKPLLALFNVNSNAINILKNCTKNAVIFSLTDDEQVVDKVYQQLCNWASGSFESIMLTRNFEDYSAENLAKKQTELFNRVVK